jgi:hypothetical protein
LQSLVDDGVATPGPTIAPEFGPTAPSFYWSSTSNAARATVVWGVGFGGMGNALKVDTQGRRVV